MSKRRRALGCAAAESRERGAAAPQCLKRLTRPRSDIFEVGGYEWKLEMYPYGDSQVVPSPRTGQIRPLLSATPRSAAPLTAGAPQSDKTLSVFLCAVDRKQRPGWSQARPPPRRHILAWAAPPNRRPPPPPPPPPPPLAIRHRSCGILAHMSQDASGPRGPVPAGPGPPTEYRSIPPCLCLAASLPSTPPFFPPLPPSPPLSAYLCLCLVAARLSVPLPDGLPCPFLCLANLPARPRRPSLCRSPPLPSNTRTHRGTASLHSIRLCLPPPAPPSPRRRTTRSRWSTATPPRPPHTPATTSSAASATGASPPPTQIYAANILLYKYLYNLCAGCDAFRGKRGSPPRPRPPPPRPPAPSQPSPTALPFSHPPPHPRKSPPPERTPGGCGSPPGMHSPDRRDAYPRPRPRQGARPCRPAARSSPPPPSSYPVPLAPPPAEPSSRSCLCVWEGARCGGGRRLWRPGRLRA